MAKPDWGVLQQRFLSDHAVTGVSPKEWCEAQGLNYATARRHIKKPIAQTAAQKKVRTAQKEKCAVELVDDDGLTAQQRLFVAEYLKDRNATQAAIRAGYSKKTANEQGARLLAKVSVAQAIAQQQKASIERTLGSADEVLSQMWQLATFDANQLSQYRRGACRYCWGHGHYYQWRDDVEFEEALAKVEGKEGVKPPEDPGGYGYDHNREPNPDCPRCNGDGIGQPYFADSRVYNGTWDGTFKWGWSNNPAWIWFDVLTEPRFGLGRRVTATMLDKWELYRIAQRCDQKVPDGKGGTGTEPRFLFDVYIQSQADAWQVIKDIAAGFNGMTFWGNNMFNVVSDMPTARS